LLFDNGRQSMKTCIIYSRVSTTLQECQCQIAQLQDYAQKQNWQVLEVITDVCSGGKGVNERPGLERVFKLSHQKKFDVLLFWALDRLSREGSRKTIQYLTRLDDDGTSWHSFTEEYLTNIGIFKDCIISLLSTLARQEKLRCSERTRSALALARLRGRVLGRRRTAGDKSAKAVLLRKQGLSYSSIGRELGISKVRAFHLVKDADKYLIPQTPTG